jgi:hypothetical protein
MAQKSFLLIILILAFYVYHKWQSTPTQYAPYPYKFKELENKIKPNSPIMIVGDRMGARFGNFKEIITQEISQDLTKPIEIDVAAKDQYGLHRTIQDIKNLSQFPKVIIYHGGSQEFIEFLFYSGDASTILKNFELFEDPKMKTLLLLFPELSKFLYKPTKMIEMSKELIIDNNKYADFHFQQRSEIQYKIYLAEIEELIKMARENDSILILTTTPTNPNIGPKLSCANSNNDDIQNQLKNINQTVKTGDLKTAYQQATLLKYTSTGNAEVYFVFQKIAESLNRFDEAKEAHNYVTALDCQAWRMNSIFNQIIRKAASENDVILYDFDLYMKDQWGKNTLFMDDIYPQDLYYQNMAKNISHMLKKLLNL